MIILLPFFVIFMMLLFIAHKGWRGIFFLQPRCGKGGKVFKIIKFKTMNDKCDREGKLLPDAQRLTRIGTFFRDWSIDELPQFINILKGDMALIGPRPLLIKYLSLYTPEQMRRHDVRPGIVGWAGVNGRNNNTWKKKFEMDVWYVDNISFRLDLKIFFLTLWTILSRSGVAKDGYVTTETFNGKN